MSDSLATRLSQFTPDASGLDRDALLFAAGRASVRPNRGWMALAGALMASQLVTLTLLGFQAAAPVTVPTPGPAPVVSPKPTPPDEPAQSTPHDAPNLFMLRNLALEAEGNLPSAHPVEQLAPSDPPLHAFAAPPAALLQ
jgi:hypothetical protein